MNCKHAGDVNERGLFSCDLLPSNHKVTDVFCRKCKEEKGDPTVIITRRETVLQPFGSVMIEDAQEQVSTEPTVSNLSTSESKKPKKPEKTKPNPPQRFIFKDGFKVYDIQSCKYRGKELDDKKRACCGGKIQREIKFECRCKKIESGQAWSRQCLDCKHRRTKNAS